MTIFSNGGPQVTADNLNQFVQTWDTVRDLRGQIGTATGSGVPQQVYLQGFSAPGDGGQGAFYWNANSIAPDDNGVTTVVPGGSAPGAWIRVARQPLTTTSTVTITSSGVFQVVSQLAVPTGGNWLAVGSVNYTVLTGCTVTIFSASYSLTTSPTQVGVSLVALVPGPSVFNTSISPLVVTNASIGQIVYGLANAFFTGTPNPTVTVVISLVPIAG